MTVFFLSVLGLECLEMLSAPCWVFSFSKCFIFFEIFLLKCFLLTYYIICYIIISLSKQNACINLRIFFINGRRRGFDVPPKK